MIIVVLGYTYSGCLVNVSHPWNELTYRKHALGNGSSPYGTRLTWTQWMVSKYSLASSNFPDSSVGKESACNAGDPGLIPGLGISSGEGIGYLLQNCWTSLLAQLVKNLPTMWETWVQFLGWEDPLGKGKATHSSILAWRIDGMYGISMG